jgi:putative transposase
VQFRICILLGPIVLRSRCGRRSGSVCRHYAERCSTHLRYDREQLGVGLRATKMMGFRSQDSAQQFLTSHAAVYNTFSTGRQHMTSRRALRVLRAKASRDQSRATCA